MSVICFHSSGITIFKIKEVKINDVENMTVPGKFYCIVLFTSKRRTWNEFLLQKCVTALDLTWHPDHFFCAQCGRPFGDDGFHEKNGKAYCR